MDVPSGFDVASHRLLARQAFDHLTIQFGQLAALAFEQIGDVSGAVVADMVTTHHVVRREIRMVGAH